MKNEIGDKCFADSMNVFKRTDDQGLEFKNVNKEVNLIAEVDGILFESDSYRTKKAWLNAIVKRVYNCSMGKLN